MQTNSQQSGQLQNLHGKGTTSGDGTPHTLDQNFYQLCLPSHAASPSYSGQGATRNYLKQFTCTIQPATSDQILTSSIQATKDTMLAQENPLTSKYTLPTGKQDSQMILWNMPPNSQIFLPVNNINLQGAPSNNGPNMSHCAFTSNNSFYMQQQNTSLAAGANNSQQVKAKTMDTKSLNEARRSLNTINLHSRQQHANSLTNLPKKLQRTSLPSDLNYYPPTENAPHGHSCLFGGYNYQSLIPGKSTHANVQTPSTCVQNIAAQRAVAVVTPLSPIGTASVNVLLDKSANMKMNERSVQEIVLHQQNIPHGLEANANLKNQKGETNDPTSMHQRPKSAEPMLNDGLCNVGAKSPVCTTESTGQSRRTSLPKSVVAEQKKSVPTQMQNEPSEKIKNNCTITDKKTETIPVIEWPLERLHTLMAMVQQIDNVHQKNVQKTDAGRDILKLYWNGDFRKFYNAVQTGIYQNIMEEVYVYCPMKEPVILRQIKSDARNKVFKDFHVLKHNEEPPKMTYKSSWLNLNENVDDIDKECGYSWFYKSFQNAPNHEAQISICKTQSNLQEATEKPSSKWLPTEVENKAPAEEPTSDNNSLHKNLPVLFNGQSPPVTDADCSPKRDWVVTVQTNSQPNITNSLEDMITVVKDLDKRDVQTGMSSSDDQFCNVRAKHVLSPKSTSQSACTNSKLNNVVAEQWEDALSQIEIGSSVKMPNNDCASLDKNVRCETFPKPNQELTLCMKEVETDKVDASASKMNVLPHEMAETSEMMEHNIIAASSDKHEPSLLNTAQVLNKISTEEQANRERLEKDKKSASTILRTLSARYEQSLAENNDGSTETTNKVQAVTDNCSLKLNVVEEQTSFQPNIINPLNGMTNLVRTLKERDYLLRKHQNFEKCNGLKRKRQHSSRTLRLNNSFCNGVGAKSPALTSESSSQSDSTSPLTLSPVVEKQPEFVSVTQVQNESSDNRVRCEIDPKPSQELSVQMDEEEIVEMDTSTSIRINVLPPEVAKQYFAGQLMENEDMTATRELICRASLLQTHQEHMLLTKVQVERLEEADGNCSLKGYLVEEQTKCQSNAVNSLKAMADLVKGVGEKQRIGKCYPLKNKHQPSTATSRLDDRSCNGAKHSSLTGSASQIDCASPPILYPVTTEPYQMQFNEEMPEIDSVFTDESDVRCETDSKPSQEIPVQMNEEEIVEMDTSIRINVLPHEVAKQCFAGQLMEDQDIAAQPEIVHNTSLLYTPQDTISTKEQMWRFEEANSNCSSNGNLVAEQTNCQSVIVHQLKSMTPLVRPVGEQHPTEKCEKPANANSRLDDRFCNKAKCLVLTTGSTCKLGLTSPHKLHPIIAESSQMQNEFNEEMPDIDYIVTDDSMRYETDRKPSQELALNTNEEETDKMDTLDSIKINVLPHDMAELWFSGEMEVKDLQEDIDVHITTEDQVKVQVLELMSEKELHLEDVTLKEGKNQSSGDEKLESYCCLAKWFQTLDYGNSSSCMCQKKAEFSEDEIKTEVHGTSLGKKEEPNELVELENSSLEETEDSEITEDSETDDEAHLPNDPIGDKTKILKDISSSKEVCEMETEISEQTRDDSPSSEEVCKMETEISEQTRDDLPSSEEVCKMETEISEQTRDDSPSKCATNVTMKNKIEQDTPTPDLKRKTNTICLALYGSSSGRKELKLTKRSKWKEICEEPPETLQVTLLSHQKVKGKSMSKNRVESQDEDVVDKRARIGRAPFNDLTLHGTLPSHPIPELSKNALSSTSIKKLLSTSANAKSGVHLGEGNKRKRRRKRQHKYSTQQMSMNKYVIRGRTAPSKLLHSPEKVTKSKYELGNPALMPLEEGLALEFKVLPESFNFEDGAELNCAQADMSQSTPNGMSGPENKLKQRETSHSPTQGVWSFSPLKKKHTQPIQVPDVSGSCSLFQEFKKRYHKKKDITSKQNSSEKV